MGRVLNISLTESQKQELEIGYKTGTSHAFRQRCRMILLKSQGRKTKDICELVEINSQNQVNTWIKRYKSSYSALGIGVLKNAEGQGRKTIFDAAAQTERIKAVVLHSARSPKIRQQGVAKVGTKASAQNALSYCRSHLHLDTCRNMERLDKSCGPFPVWVYAS